MATILSQRGGACSKFRSVEWGVAEVLPQTIDLLPDLRMPLQEVDELGRGDTQRLSSGCDPSLQSRQHVQGQASQGPERRMFHRARELAGLESKLLPHDRLDHDFPVRSSRDSFPDVEVKALPQTL